MREKLQYKFFDALKSTELPSLSEVINFKLNGITPVLVLDSCVCLDIINYIDNKSINETSLQKIINLFTYRENSMIDVLWSFGVLELSHNRKNYCIDAIKFSDFLNKIEFAMSLSLENIINKNFTGFVNEKKESKENIFPILPMLNSTYCCLLKIREIKIANPKKIYATKNFLKFMEWMENELNIISSTEIELAKLIFCGHNNFLTMIGMKKDKVLAKRQLWGSAWDILHYRINIQYLSTVPLDGIQNQPYFITNDGNLIMLSSKQTNVAVTKHGKSIHRIFVSSEFESSCFKKDSELLMLKMQALHKRRQSKITEKLNSKEDILLMIKNLEIKNDIA